MTNPLARFVGSGSQQPVNPLAKFVQGSETAAPEPFADTALGTRFASQENIQSNIDKLKEIKMRASGAQQAHLDKLIKAMEAQKEGWTRPGSDHGVLFNAVRGLAAGIPGGVISVADLALMIPDLFGSEMASQGRQALAERREVINQTLDPQGGVGAVAEFAGEMPAQMLALGPLAGKTLQGVAKILPKAAPLLTGAVEGNLAKRMLIGGGRNAIADLPISALQAGTMQGSTPEDRWRQFGINEAASAAFGVLGPAPRSAKATAGAGKTVPTESTVPAEAPSGTQILDELAVKQAAVKAKRDEAKRLQNLAMAKWTQENGGKSWKGDLTDEQRKAYVKQFLAEHKAANPEPAPAEVVPIQETATAQAERDLAVAQAMGSPKVIEAAQAKVETAAALPPPAPPVQPTTSPTLDKPTGGVSPKVAEVLRKKELRAAFEALGAPFNASAPVDVLERQLAALNNASAVFAPQQGPLQTRAGIAAGETASPKIIEAVRARGLAIIKELDALPEGTPPDNPRATQLRAELAALTEQADQMGILPPDTQIGQESFSPELANKPTVFEGKVAGAETPITVADIASPAVKDIQTGQVTSGAIHADAMAAAGKPREAFIQGYVTKDGRFIDYPTADAIAAKEDVSLDHGPQPASASNAASLTEPSVDIWYDKETKSWVGQLKDAQGNQIGEANYAPTKKQAQQMVDLDLAQLKSRPATSEPSGGTVSSAPPAVAVAVAEQKPAGTFLRLLKTEKPLEELTNRKLGDIEERLANAAQNAKDADRWKIITDELALVRAEVARREQQVTPLPERPHAALSLDDLIVHQDAIEQTLDDISAKLKTVGIKERPALRAEQKATQERLEAVRKEINLRKVESRPEDVGIPYTERPIEVPKVFDFRKAVSQLGTADLEAQLTEIDSRLSVIDRKDAGPWHERLTNIMEELAKRKEGPSAGPGDIPPIQGGPGGKGEFRLQTHPVVTGFAYGFTGGIISPMDEEDSDGSSRLSRAFMWGLGSGGMYMGGKYLLARQKVAGHPKESPNFPGSEDLPKRVYSSADMEGPKFGMLTRLRQFYAGLVRSVDGIEHAPYRKDLPTQKNPAKLAEMQGSFAAQSERWFTTKVEYINPKTGMPEPVLVKDASGQMSEVRPLSYIVDTMAKGDSEGLANLSVALSSAELAAKGVPDAKLPMPQIEREFYISRAPDWMIAAARELRRFNLAGAELQRQFGMLSDEGFAKFESEDFYTPLHRIVEQMQGLSKTRSDKIPAKKALFGRKGGSNKSVLSPVDVSMNMTVRILRATEYNNIVTNFVDRMMELPKDVRSTIIQPVGKQLNKHALNVDGVEQEIRKWANVSMTDAKAMLAYMDSEAINGKPGVISHFRNGEIQSYRVNAEVFQAFKALSPQEMEMAWKLIGFPARVASKGVVYHPSFIAIQFIADSFHGTLLSEYGFRPGIDSIRGWLHEFVGSKKYQELLAAGGPTSLQSLPYLASETRGEAVRLAADAPYKLMWNQMKELKIWEAYKTFALPLANAARVGEYLRALDHGASTIEAAYAAQNLIGNYRMQGSFGAMRVFNYITMFSRPAIAAMDKTVERMGIHPYREPRYAQTGFGQWAKETGINPRTTAALSFMTKGFIGITIPTMLLWNINRDDEEINQVRRTPMGQRYWFFRKDPETIIRVRRPQVIGEFFGSSAEAMLDKMYKDDPDGTTRLLGALWDDAALNVLPQIGVVPLSLWANKKTGFGSPIIPGRDSRIDPAMQGRSESSLPSRIVADALDPVSSELNLEPLRTAASPAGLDYIFGTFGGMLGQDALRGLNAALVYETKGYLPAKEELPITSRLIARYPSMNVKEVQEFYNRDRKVQAAAGTIKEYVQSQPQLLGDYYVNNMDRIQLIKLHDETRQKVADLRRAIDDLKNAPAGTIDKDVVDQTTKTFTELIIQQMKIVNDFARQMKR